MTLFEMSLPQRKKGGGIGAEIALDAPENNLQNDTILFGQTGGFVLEIDPKTQKELLKRAQEAGVVVAVLGKTVAEGHIRIERNGQTLLSEKLNPLQKTWENGLKKAWN